MLNRLGGVGGGVELPPRAFAHLQRCQIGICSLPCSFWVNLTIQGNMKPVRACRAGGSG